MIRIYIFLLVGLFFYVQANAQSTQINSIRSYVDGQYTKLFDLYKHYHTHPELSFYETNTAKRMAEELRTVGFEVTENFGGNGVVGVYKNGDGPTVLVRADMDALPIVEETNLAYASTVTTTDGAGNTVGVMHACGHDIHMTVWAGTARTLVHLKNQWKGTLIFVGQPAEERAGGAKAMFKTGLYEKFPTPDYAIALHVSANLEAGKVAVCPEYAMANVNMVDITVYGEGGHGAYPHLTKDPIVLAARIVTALQTIVSREISPLEPAVVTIGSIHGGSKGNVIPNEVKLELTLRSYNDDVQQALIEKIERICKGEAIAAGLSEDKFPTITVLEESTPSLWNTPELTERLAKTFRSALGDEQVKTLSPVMGGEDFSLFGRQEQKVPITMFWLGTIEPEKVAAAAQGQITLPSLHSSKYAPVPEPSIKTGVVAMTAAVLELLSK